jgi:hypothetical protein
MEYLCHKWPRIYSVCRNNQPVLSSFMTYHWVFNNSNTTGATNGTGTTYPSGAHEFTSGLDTEQQKQSSSPLHEKTIRATQQRTYILYITPWPRQVWNTRFSTAYTEKRLGKTSRSNQVCIQIFIIIVYYFYFATQFLRDVSQSG